MVQDIYEKSLPVVRENQTRYSGKTVLWLMRLGDRTTKKEN